MATRRKGLRKQRSYTDVDRRKAAFLFALHGVMSKVSKDMNIPETTLSSWTRAPEWDETLAEARSEASDILIAEFTQCAVEAVQGARERAEKGDWHFDSRTTGLYRVPMKGKDLGILAAIATEKSLLLQNRPTTITAHADGRLEQLFAKFEQAGKQLSQRMNEKVIEGQVIKE